MGDKFTDLALRDINKALELNPDDAKSLLVRANICMDGGRNPKLAKQDFDRLVSLDSRYTSVRNRFDELEKQYAVKPANANLFLEDKYRTNWD